MKWQTALGLGAALLLILPLAVLIAGVLHPRPRVELQAGRPVSPVLDTDERTRLATYHRNCTESSDCEPPLGCVVDGRVWITYCTDSQCMTDAQCPEGAVCRAVASQGEGPQVRFCIPLGSRKAGERCSGLPRRLDEACGPGLLCGGKKGWCGHPCQPRDAAACPEGFFCAEEAPVPLCLPTCETRGCPTDQQCIHYEGGVSACAAVYGRNCQQAICPSDQQCQILDGITAPGSVWMDCIQACGEAHPKCPEGNVCSMGMCSRACEPQSAHECGENFRCKQLSPGKPWRCSPDW